MQGRIIAESAETVLSCPTSIRMDIPVYRGLAKRLAYPEFVAALESSPSLWQDVMLSPHRVLFRLRAALAW